MIHGVDPEHGKGNPIGDLLYKAYKAAPRATPPQSPAPVDLAAAVAKRAGSASEKMLALAREHQRIFPNKSDEAAYTAVYTDPRNVALKQKVVEEHWSLVGVGDTAYQDSHGGAYSNPHPGGSGPRPST